MTIKTFPGGYRFRRFAGQPEGSLEEAGIPERVSLPLRGPQGADLNPLIKTGDQVTAGQIIARDPQSSSLILATVTGVAEELKPAAWLGGKTKVAVIRSDGSTGFEPLEGHGGEWRSLSREKLAELIARSGAPAVPADTDQVLVHELETEAYNPSPALLFGTWNLEDFVEGMAILSKILPEARLHVALSRARRSLLGEIAGQARRSGLEIHPHCTAPKYPQTHREILMPTLFGKERPRRALLLDVQTIFQLRDAVVSGKPLIDRIVALGGTGFARRPHLRVRIGAPIGKLLEGYLRPKIESRIVLNSLICGSELKDPVMPVSPDLSVLIALPENREGGFLSFASPGFTSDSFSITFAASLLPVPKRLDTNLHGEHRSCISCGFCESVCPVRIMPNVLHRYVERNRIDETLVRYRIFRCIDCNLCSYVCTSKIPLARLMRDGKERLRKEGFEPQEVRP